MLPIAISLVSLASARHTDKEEKRYIPHTSQQLDKTTITESRTDDNVRLSDVPSTHVDSRKDESSQGESRQAQRSRVGKLALLDRPVQTGLEFTTERRKTSLSRVDLGQRTVAKAGSSTGNLVLLGGHHGGSGRTLAGVVDVSLGGSTNVLFDLLVFGRHFGYCFFRLFIYIYMGMSFLLNLSSRGDSSEKKKKGKIKNYPASWNKVK